MDALRTAVVRHFEYDFPISDRAAIATFSGRPTLDFTNDRTKLAAAASKLKVRLASWNNRSACPYIPYYLADMIQNRGEQSITEAAISHTAACAHVLRPMAEMMVRAASEQALVSGAENNQVALWTLRRAIRRLAEMPGERMVVMASQGFYSQTTDARRGMAEVLDLAAKANVTIGGLDPHGVERSDQDASESRQPDLNWLKHVRENYLANNDAVAALTQGTGGVFFKRSNDLQLGFIKATTLPEYSYVLAFSPSNLKPDGNCHSLKIHVMDQKGLKIEARQGYYASKADSKDRMARAPSAS